MPITITKKIVAKHVGPYQPTRTMMDVPEGVWTICQCNWGLTATLVRRRGRRLTTLDGGAYSNNAENHSLVELPEGVSAPGNVRTALSIESIPDLRVFRAASSGGSQYRGLWFRHPDGEYFVMCEGLIDNRLKVILAEDLWQKTQYTPVHLKEVTDWVVEIEN